MMNIERISKLHKENLNEEFYFASLVEEALKLELISQTDVENIQMGTLQLLAERTARYTAGDSSSVRIEIAEKLMKSNLYTVGIALKNFPIPDDALQACLTQSITALYKIGRNLIDVKQKSAKFLQQKTLATLCKTTNYTYNSTLINEVNNFFKSYDPDFGANEIHMTANYPLCNPIENLTGIEFIETYLESIYCENLFCSYFKPEIITAILQKYNEDEESDIFNIFSQVYSHTINSTNSQLIQNAYQTIVKTFNITNTALLSYMEKSLIPLAVFFNTRSA